MEVKTSDNFGTPSIFKHRFCVETNLQKTGSNSFDYHFVNQQLTILMKDKKLNIYIHVTWSLI